MADSLYLQRIRQASEIIANGTSPLPLSAVHERVDASHTHDKVVILSDVVADEQ